MALPRLAGRGGRSAWAGLRSGGRWLTTQVLAMAPRLPVRSADTLRGQFPGRTPDELADIADRRRRRGPRRASARPSARRWCCPSSRPCRSRSAWRPWPWSASSSSSSPSCTRCTGMRPQGSKVDRTMAYVDSWAHRRGVGLAPGRPGARDRLAAAAAAGAAADRRAGRSAFSLGPLLTGAAAGALLNRRETRKLGQEIRTTCAAARPPRPWPTGPREPPRLIPAPRTTAGPSSSVRSSRPSEPSDSAAMCQALRSKAAPLAALRRRAAGQPGPLAELVADGLAGRAQVADDLAVDERGVAAAVGPEELPGQLGRPGLARAQRRVGRDRQAQVHADVRR